VAIWQDLVDECGLASSYQSVQRFVRKLRGVQTPETRVVIVTAPGQEAQVDYGTGPMVRDPETRKYRRTRLFVMTLGCSRKSVRLLAFRSSARIWADSARASVSPIRRGHSHRGPRFCSREQNPAYVPDRVMWPRRAEPAPVGAAKRKADT